MVYAAFDMDGTLGDFMILWPLVSGLLHTGGDREKNPLYVELVRQVAIREKGSTPIGIFRPGIFNVMRRVAKMKKDGSVTGVIIYTNNGSLELAHFVRDVIHRVLRYTLFDDVIHFYHHLRVVGTDGRTPNQKTWFELYHLLVLGLVRAPDTITPTDVLFMDDQDHKELAAQLGTNYIRVPEYTYGGSIAPIIDIIASAAMMHAGGGIDLFRYTGFHGSLEKYLAHLRRGAAAAGASATAVAVPDSGSAEMLKGLWLISSPFSRRGYTRRRHRKIEPE